MKNNIENCATSDVLPEQVTYALLSLHGIIFLIVSIYTFINIRKTEKYKKAVWWKKIKKYCKKKKKNK